MERERTQVLNHLAHCAECREIAAFTLPAESAVAERDRLEAGRRWSPWLVLRWGAMAAVLGALAIVVVLHPRLWKGHPELSQRTHPEVPAVSSSAPQSVAPTPSAQSSSITAKAQGHTEARESSNELTATGNASRSRRELGLNDRAARAQAKQQTRLMAESRPPAVFRTEGAPAASVEQKKGEEGPEIATEAAPASPPLPAAAPAAPVTSEEVTKASADSQVGRESLRITRQNVAVAGGNAGASPAQAASVQVAPRAPAQAPVRLAAQAPTLEMRASSKGLGFAMRPPAALWSVSAEGKVQHSTDGGKTFKPVEVAHGIKFGAIATLGNDVWAGGEGGALYHSADGGATWNRTGISSQGNAVTESITAIQLHDPQNLTITTTSGTKWVTADGGQNWRKQS